MKRKIIKPILADILNGKKIKPFLGPLKFEKKEGNVLLVEIGDKKTADKIGEPVIINPQTFDTIKGVLDKAKAIITFNIDTYYSIEDDDTLHISMKINKKASQLIARLWKKKMAKPEVEQNGPAESSINYLQLAEKT
ncbi:MAG: hypothetical protein IPJ02_15940 [Chitinophagaceae bacterium]|nr:hypothetical protein [Chitinophagaceae bacterium]